MKNVAIYCRISTQQQHEDRQIDILIDLIAKHNECNVDNDNYWSFCKNDLYVDVISGFRENDERIEFSRLKNNIEAGKRKIDIILFTELSRLGRNSTSMLTEIKYFRNLGIDLYFNKESLWITDNQNDIGGRILVNVLSVLAEYEIEVFAERSITGKISKLQQKGYGYGTITRTYGYTTDKSKKMVIEPTQKEIVSLIFDKFASGVSGVEIANYLNLHGAPSPGTILHKKGISNRKEKGLAEKNYSHYKEGMKWRPSQIAKMLNNEIYIGKVHIEYRKPNPRGKETKSQRKEREIMYIHDEQNEDVRIISDDLWNKVQERLAQAHYNKNNAVKHDNLVKDKMKCGECGSNYSVSGAATNSTKNVGDRKYACYGMKNVHDHPKVCFRGSTMLMWRVDGLIVTLSLKMFAEDKIADSNGNRIAEEQAKIKEYQESKGALKNALSSAEAEYENALLMLTKVGDNTALKLAQKKSDDFKIQKDGFDKQIAKLDAQIHKSQVIIEQTERMQVSVTNLHAKMDELRNSKELVKLMVETMLESIIVYRIHQNWNLLIVKYYNGTELWATIKAARYKKSETFDNPYLCAYGEEYLSWLIDNTDGSFSYNKETQKITYKGGSEIYTSFPVGEYTYEEMDKLLVETENIISFPLYDYEGQTLCRPVDKNSGLSKSKDESDQIDWQKHNDQV